MSAALLAYHRCIEDRISGKVFTTEDNNFSDHALTVYVMAVTALEAFINEVCFGPSSKMLNKDRIPLNFFEDMEIRRKYYLLPLLLWGRTFNRGAQPYQDFEILIRLRNSLVHYKMKTSARREVPKYVEQLEGKGLLLRIVEGPSVSRIWVSEVSTSKGALWAYNTACRMADKLVKFGDEDTRMIWGGMLENFKQVSDDYWKSVVH